MSRNWLEIRVTLPDEAVDIASQLLIEVGSTGVTAAEQTLDTFVVPPPESLANAPVIKAYFEQNGSPETLCKKIREKFKIFATVCPGLQDALINHGSLNDQDWANDWKQHFPPFRVGNTLVICPTWIDWRHEKNEIVLDLDPGQAFGTGTHATTSLCLDAIDHHFTSQTPPKTVLDVGTGSGILAMAAAALGAQRVLANDIDITACDIALQNVNNNGLSNRVTVTTTPIEQIPGTFDLVIANILAGENIRLARELVKHLNPGGRLVLSGILIEQEQDVLNGFTLYELSLLTTDHRDEWACIVYRSHE